MDLLHGLECILNQKTLNMFDPPHHLVPGDAVEEVVTDGVLFAIHDIQLTGHDFPEIDDARIRAIVIEQDPINRFIHADETLFFRKELHIREIPGEISSFPVAFRFDFEITKRLRFFMIGPFSVINRNIHPEILLPENGKEKRKMPFQGLIRHLVFDVIFLIELLLRSDHRAPSPVN